MMRTSTGSSVSGLWQDVQKLSAGAARSAVALIPQLSLQTLLLWNKASVCFLGYFDSLMLVVPNIRWLQAAFHHIITDLSSCFVERVARCSLAADSATSVEHNVALVIRNNTVWSGNLACPLVRQFGSTCCRRRHLMNVKHHIICLLALSRVWQSSAKEVSKKTRSRLSFLQEFGGNYSLIGVHITTGRE